MSAAWMKMICYKLLGCLDVKAENWVGMECLVEVARPREEATAQQVGIMPSPGFSGPRCQGYSVPFCGVCHPSRSGMAPIATYISTRTLSQTRMVQQQDQSRCPNSIQSRLHKTPTPAAHHETHAMPSVTSCRRLAPHRNIPPSGYFQLERIVRTSSVERACQQNVPSPARKMHLPV